MQNVRVQMTVQPTITVTRLVQLFMHRRHFIGQNVLVSAILDSKVHRSSAFQPTCNCSPKRWRDIAIGGEDHSVIQDQNYLGISFPLCSDTSLSFYRTEWTIPLKRSSCISVADGHVKKLSRTKLNYWKKQA